MLAILDEWTQPIKWPLWLLVDGAPLSGGGAG